MKPVGLLLRIVAIVVMVEAMLWLVEQTVDPSRLASTLVHALLLAGMATPLLYSVVVKGAAADLSLTAVRAERDFIEAILEVVGSLVVVLDPAGRIVRFNRACEAATGYRSDEVEGRNVFELLITPEERDGVREVFQDLREEKVPNRFENEWLTRTGERRRIAWSNTVLKDDDGRVSYLIGTGIDVTERRAAESDRARFKMGIERSSEVVFLTDVDGRIVYANPAFEAVYGWSPQEVLGRTPRILKSGQMPRSFYEDFWARLLSGEVVTGEIVNRTKDGGLVHIEGSANPVTDSEGNLIGFLAIQRDVTERRLLEEQLRVSQKMEALGRLAGGVAHDFNNLLTTIIGITDLSLMEHIGDSELVEDLGEIKQAAKRATLLTHQLLAFSRAHVAQPEILNLNEVVRDLEVLLERLIGEDIRVVTILEGELPFVRADAGQMEQVVMNLAINARDAMPDGGRLTIETASVDPRKETRLNLGSDRGSVVMLTISDTGHGMDDATQARVFEPLFTTKAEGKGTGIGLSTVYEIVRLSGGRVTVESEVGKGTTFCVFLPQAEAAPIRSGEPVEVVRRGGSETIVLVEDEDTVREVGRRILARHGYQVLVAARAREALEICRELECRVDLLVTDVVMPEMSGPQLAIELRKICPTTPVLFVSGYPDDELIDRGLDEPGTAFLQKPFPPEILLGRIRQILDGNGDDGGEGET